MEMPRKNLKEMVEIKNTAIEMKNAFDELISRLHTDEERISKPEDRSIETSKTELQREKLMKIWNRLSKNCGTVIKGVTHVLWDYQKEKGKKNLRNIWGNNIRIFQN